MAEVEFGAKLVKLKLDLATLERAVTMHTYWQARYREFESPTHEELVVASGKDLELAANVVLHQLLELTGTKLEGEGDEK